jgi:predicted secreted hydrolase
VWNEGWEARLDGETHVLSAAEDDFRLELELIAEKPPVIHGEHGVSQKGAAVGNASHYYSLTRLRTTGRITIKGESFVVSGLSWMDHEFGTSFLEQEHVGWDWFSIQLEDGRDLMVFQVRRADGSMDPHSSGTLVERDGRSSLLRFGEFFLTPESSWRSTASGASYPIAWTIAVPGKGLNFFVSAVFPTQELQTNASTGVTYWEGSVSVTEAGPAKTLAGHGYLEMTGYAGKSMGAVFGGK